MPRTYSVLFALLASSAVLGPWLLVALLEGSADAATSAVPLAVHGIAVGVSVTCAAASFALWHFVERRMRRPVRRLARDLRTIGQARRVERGLREVAAHDLGDLPQAVAVVVDELGNARREMVRAMASATARAEQDKGWLEHILLELVPQGVVVCNFEHQVLLYNHAAAQLLSDAHALGLGRPLGALIAMGPLEHALERLELMLKAGRRDRHLGFVCETVDRARLLQTRITLVLDAQFAATGYAITLEDVSADIARRRAGAVLERVLTHEIRGPLASLRAAAEALTRKQDIAAEHRRAFQQVMVDESARLSAVVERLAAAQDARSEGAWPMSEVHSADLLGILSDRLAMRDGIELVAQGEGTWITADSHVLLAVLLDLGAAAATQAGARQLVAEAGARGHRSFVELRLGGEPLPPGSLESWLDRPLSLLPELSMREALDLHGSEPWIVRAPAAGAGIALHVPLETAREPASAAPGGVNPERYDFDLMVAQGLRGTLGEQRLSDLSFVVFDTETTGLRPAAGDRVISIAGVRVARGRVLSGETFDALVNPGRSIPKQSIRFHGITDERVADEPPIETVLPRFHAFAADAVLVAHNAAFDMRFVKLSESRCDVRFDNPVIDTLLLSLLLDGEDEDHSLDGICERLDVRIEGRHSALGDAMATAHVLVHLLERLAARKLYTFNDLMRATQMEDQLKARAHQFA